MKDRAIAPALLDVSAFDRHPKVRPEELPAIRRLKGNPKDWRAQRDVRAALEHLFVSSSSVTGVRGQIFRAEEA